MNDSSINFWLKQEFGYRQLATPDTTILQLIRNAKRRFNTNSCFPVAAMFPCNSSTTVIQLTPDYKNVVRVYPATTPDWVLQNYPLWSLLGITVIDNLTSDLIVLAEAYKNYRYYMGADFNWKYQKSDNPVVGGKLYMTGVPANTLSFCVIGTKRIIDGEIQLNFTGTSGTFQFVPITQQSFSIANDTQTYTDDGQGNLVSSIGGYSGTINYTTGAWTVTGWADNNWTGTATYNYSEDITSEYILNFILYYSKALLKMTEGNTLRATGAINIKSDGQELINEGKEEIKDQETKLDHDSRWLALVRRF